MAGCIATGATLEETTRIMRSALIFHLENEQELPKPRGIDAYLDALRDSEGEEFYLTYVPVANFLNQRIEQSHASQY